MYVPHAALFKGIRGRRMPPSVRITSQPSFPAIARRQGQAPYCPRFRGTGIDMARGTSRPIRLEGCRLKAGSAEKPVDRLSRSTVAVDVLRFVVGCGLFLFGLGLMVAGFLTIVFHTTGMSTGIDPVIGFFIGLTAVTVGLSTIADMRQVPPYGPRNSP